MKVEINKVSVFHQSIHDETEIKVKNRLGEVIAKETFPSGGNTLESMAYQYRAIAKFLFSVKKKHCPEILGENFQLTYSPIPYGKQAEQSEAFMFTSEWIISSVREEDSGEYGSYYDYEDALDAFNEFVGNRAN